MRRINRGIRSGRRFGLCQAPASPVVIKDFSIASPVLGGFELPLHFVFRKMFIEDIVEKFIRDCMILFAVQNAVDLLEDHDVLEGSVPE